MAKTILVVEDDQNISELLRLYLEKEGYTVNIADDGGKGVELYRRLKPDLVLLDLMLPVLDGWVCQIYIDHADNLVEIYYHNLYVLMLQR